MTTKKRSLFQEQMDSHHIKDQKKNKILNIYWNLLSLMLKYEMPTSI